MPIMVRSVPPSTHARTRRSRLPRDTIERAGRQRLSRAVTTKLRYIPKQPSTINSQLRYESDKDNNHNANRGDDGPYLVVYVVRIA